MVDGGDVIVVRPGETLDIVAVNSLGGATKGETFRSSLVPLGEKWLLRSDQALYAIGR